MFSDPACRRAETSGSRPAGPRPAPGRFIGCIAPANAAFFLLVVAFWSAPAGAASSDPTEPIHPANASATLHGRPELGVAVAGGFGVGRFGGGLRPLAHGRMAVEFPLRPLPIYLGFSYAGGLGAADGLAPRPATGAIALGGRAAWGSAMGFAFGGGFDVLVPTRLRGDDRFRDADPVGPLAIRSAYRGAADRVATFAGPEADAFWPRGVVFRPSVDLRLVTGRFVFQAREAIGLAIDARAPFGTEAQSRITASLTLYAAYRLSSAVAIDLETAEFYLVSGTETTEDGRRARFLVTPGLRLLALRGTPTLSFPIAPRPTADDAQAAFGVKAGMTFVF